MSVVLTHVPTYELVIVNAAPGSPIENYDMQLMDTLDYKSQKRGFGSYPEHYSQESHPNGVVQVPILATPITFGIKARGFACQAGPLGNLSSIALEPAGTLTG